MANARRQELRSSVQEIVGLSLLVLGVLLFLALISYTPRDVPSWYPGSFTDHPNKTTQNFVGSLGAMMACTSYLTLGAASYLLAVALIAYGATALMGNMMGFSLRPIWTAGFVISGASLVHVLGWSLIDRGSMKLSSEGGIIGEMLGGKIFFGIFGPASIIVLLLIYVVCLILMTGLRPIAVFRRALAFPGQMIDRYREWQFERADEQRKLEMETRRLTRERKKLERELAKKVVAVEDDEEEEADEEEDSGRYEQTELLPAQAPETKRPAPKIFDSAAPPPPVAGKKEKKKPSHQLLSAIHSENYEFPSLDLLDAPDLASRHVASHEELLSVQNQIIDTLAEFGISVTGGDITKGPTITRYEVYPAKGVRVDRIASYERDLARATRAERINILAPIPGKDTVGIEIANSSKQKVTLRELLESEEFVNAKGRIPIALGKDVYGHTIIADLAAMPHGLVAGTTGSGKSVCINAILASILYRFTPEDLRLIMIDPKVVEMQVYNTLPHLVVPVVTDPKKTLLALKWAVNEMEKRYAIFAKVGVRNIGGFNSRPKPKTQAELDEDARGKANPKQAPLIVQDPDADAEAASSTDILGKSFGEELEETPVLNADAEMYGEPTGVPAEHELDRAEQAELGISVPRDDGISVPEKMPFIVVIVDELADLMQTAPADVEMLIARITQKARAAGIHMIIATQTPRADVITGVIKANVPCRIAFQVASPLDSRVILDENGAERLLGMGDLLYRPPGTSKLLRCQGVLVTDEEVHRIVEFVSRQSDQCFESEIHDKLESMGDGDDEEEVSDEDEELVQKCLEVMAQEQKASTSLFQRRLRLGYTRAARILDIMEARGYVGPGDGAKPREILRMPD